MHTLAGENSNERGVNYPILWDIKISWDKQELKLHGYLTVKEIDEITKGIKHFHEKRCDFIDVDLFGFKGRIRPHSKSTLLLEFNRL